MRGLRSTLIVVVALYLLAIALSAFLLPEGLPAWGVGLVWVVAGALVAALVRPARWWVALGFLCLGAAWVEAGQAVWFEREGSVWDVLVGCVASAAGVAATLGLRRLRRRGLAHDVRPRTPAAPRHR